MKLNHPLSFPESKRLTFIGLLGLAATCIGPDPIERFRYAFKPELAHPIHRTFSEMQPTWTTIATPPFNFAPMYLVAALVLLTIVCRFRQYRLWELSYLVVLTLLGMRAVSGQLHLNARPAPAHDVYAAAQMRDLRFALELYERERGHYPERLEALVSEDWVHAQQVEIPGYRLEYTPVDGGNDYRLDLAPR